MAKEVIEIVVPTGSIDGGINSLRQLKAELKSAQSAALNGDGVAAKRVAELKDKMEDLRDTTKTLQGSGVEKIQSSFALLGEGLATFDFDKIKSGFNGLGAAMKAIPIFLIIEGIRLLIENFGAIVEWGKNLFDVFSDDERAVRALTKEMNIQKEVTAGLIKELTRELQLMEAKGESDDKLLAKKKEIIKTQLDEAVSIAKVNFAKLKQAEADATIAESTLVYQSAIFRKLGQDEAADKIDRAIHASKVERTKEQAKAFKDSQELIKDLTAKGLSDSLELDKKEREKKAELDKKHKEDDVSNAKEHQKKLADATEDARKKFAEEHGIKALQDRLKEREAFLQAEEDAEIKEEERRAQVRLQTREQQFKVDQQEIADFLAKEQQKRLIKKQTEDAGLNLTRTALQAAQTLTDIVFNNQSSRLKKGSAEAEAIAKKQFNVNKGLQLGLASIDGFKAITASLASSPLAIGVVPNPVGIANLIATSIAVAANIAKIASAQFKPEGGGGSAEAPNVNLGGGGGGGGSPTTQAPPSINQQSTFLGENPQNKMTVEVVETQSTNVQNRVKRLERQATF